MTFEITHDEDVIREIVTHPMVYPAVSDDYSPSVSMWQPPDAHFFLVKDGNETLGLWAMTMENGICWKAHTCLLPISYGERARRAASEFREWIWIHTPCLRIITDVPRYNTLAYRFALAAGMKQFGVNPKAYMKNGTLHDVIMLGVSKCL